MKAGTHMRMMVAVPTGRERAAAGSIPTGSRAGRVLFAVLFALVLVIAALEARRAPAADDPVGIRAVAQDLRAGIEGLIEQLGAVPDPARDELGVEARVLAHSIEQTLRRLEQLPVPLVEPEVASDLAYLGDVVQAASEELRAGAGGDRGLPVRLELLASTAAERLAAVDVAVDRWRQLTEAAVVEVEREADTVRVRSMDRLLYDGVRYAGAALFLIGVLVLGVRLLSIGESGLGLGELARHAPIASAVGLAAFLLFLVGSAVLTASPGALVGPSRETGFAIAQHPCDVLARQRQDLWAAQEVGNPRLIQAVTGRMAPAAQDCLGLESRTAAIAAVERAAARRRTPEPALAALAGPDEVEPAAAEAPDQRAAPAPTPPAVEVREVELVTQAKAAEPPAAPAPDATPATPARAARPDQRPAVAAADSGTAAAAVIEPAMAPATPRPRRDLVTTTAVNYRSGPSLEATRLGILAEGTRVLLLGEADEWANVQLNDGRSVYVSSSFLRPGS